VTVLEFVVVELLERYSSGAVEAVEVSVAATTWAAWAWIVASVRVSC